MGENLPPGVLNLTGRNNNRNPPVPPAAPRPPANARPPAPPPAPGQVAQMPPPPPPPGHQQQMQPMHPVFPQPPVHMIPEPFRQRRLVERSDIRREKWTEADAREILSDYVIYRFEKLIDENEVDEEGYPTLPTWENVIRTEVRDMNKQAATRQIRALDRTTKSVAEKKASLIPAQQRQLEVALEELMRAEDDPRYYYVLVQIDHQLKKLNKPTYASYQTYYSDKKKDSKKVTVGRRRSTSSKSKERKKTKYERISLTAYYKRMPKPEENASQMLIQRERMMHMRLFPQPQPVMVHQMPPQQLVQPQPVQKVSGGVGKGGHVAIDVKTGKNQEIKIIRDGSPRSSRSSSSDGYSYGSTEYTPNSSLDSASVDKKHYRGRSRSRHRPHERPEYYGMDAPRRHSRHEQHYIMESFPPPAPVPPSPLPLPPPQEIEDAFHAGRIQGVRDAIRDTERILEARPRSALPPRIINGGRPPVRALPAYEVAQLRYEDDLDRLERLQIDTERGYEREFELAAEIREEELRRRMALENRHRRQRLAEDALVLEEQQMWAEDRAKDYIRNNERVDAPNPFRPIGARARRHSYTYYD